MTSAKRAVALVPLKGLRRARKRGPARVERAPAFPDWQEEIVRPIRKRCAEIQADAPWELYERAERMLGAPLFDINGAKLFGYQSALQGAVKFDCPDCRRPMEFLAQAAIDVDGVEVLYLLRCPRHRRRIAAEPQYA